MCNVFATSVVYHIFVIGVMCVVGVRGVACTISNNWFSLFVGWSRKVNRCFKRTTNIILS